MPGAASTRAARVALSRDGESCSKGDLILDAAERHFAQRDFAAVAVREIAADAGLKNQASLYHHVKNKRSIYEAVLARGIRPLIQMLAVNPSPSVSPSTAAAREGGPEALVDKVVDYLGKRRHLASLLQRAGLDEARYLRRALSRYMRPLYDEGLRRLATAGTPWAPEELPHVAAGFYHLIFGYFADACMLTGVLDSDLRRPDAIAREKEFLRTVVRTLLAGDRR